MPAVSDSPSRPTFGAPPSWLPLVEGKDGEPGPGKEAPIPGPHLPSIETVDYLSKLILLVMLLLGLPWLVGKFITDPEHVMRHAANRAAPGAA